MKKMLRANAIAAIVTSSHRLRAGMVARKGTSRLEKVRALNGPAVMSLVNGVRLIPVRRFGDWLLVAAGVTLRPRSHGRGHR
jgi:hypothetical protein